MAVKTQRLEARLDPDTRERISEAAAVTGETMSAFVTRAARSEADRVLARADVVMMNEDLFDQMIATLDAPDAAPHLARAAARERSFTRADERS
ncbi:MAG: DUF1778 domain-containing protein [Candidatus Nanopelagicales bacterium]|nr:DUF1778 domain-containing protein [Candidatus Nanopelagicales bacterium]